MARIRCRLFVPLAALVAVGCDCISAGQLAEPSGPPRLLRVMAQPRARSCTRCDVTDLLDTRPPPTCAIDRPCPVEFQVLGNAPPTCQLAAGATTGICSDPLAAAPVGLGGPDEGNAFRLVFDKLLDPALDGVGSDADGNPVPLLKSGIAELDDPAGAPLAVTAFYDPTGASTTSDAIQVPFGPAIELDAIDALAPNTTYTIKLASTRAVERTGRAPTDADGTPLPQTYLLTFTTQASLPLLVVTPDISGSPDAQAMTPSIAPDDVIQLQFAAPIADPAASGSTAKVTLSSDGNAIAVEAWRDQGAPKSCAGNPYQLDIVAVSAPGTPAPLAAGLYTLEISGVIDGIYGNAQPYGGTFHFYVTGSSSNKDPNAVGNFYVPGAGACQ